MKAKYFLILFICLIPPVMAQADVVTDGTVGPAQSLNGPNFQIPHDLGKTAGQNLFHSFQQFSISNGQSATFTGPDAIQNVILRVTGGEISAIDGLLRSQIGNADFFFINPTGVVFGPNAKVDVPAAFHVSTADELRFADGNVFSAASPGTSTLTAANPESFGYLSPQPASIVLNGSRLEFASESKVSLTGGDVSIAGTSVAWFVREAEIFSEGGEIRISAIGDQTGEIPVSGRAETVMKGSVTFESASIDSSGNGGGSIMIQAGNTEITDTTIAAVNTGSQSPYRGISLFINGNISINQDSRAVSGVLDKGDSGDIEISADGYLYLNNGSEISSYTEDSGNAGSLDINAGNIQTENSVVGSSTVFGATGNAGNIHIRTDELTIRGSEEQVTGIFNQTLTGASGNAGSVDVTVNGLMEMSNGAEISSSTFSEGSAGSITIRAGTIRAGELRIDDQGSESPTGIASNAGRGSGGDAGFVDVTVDGLLEMSNGARISSDTFSEGKAGSVTVRTGELKINGQGSESLTGITSDSNPGSGGDAGSVDVTVDGLLEMSNGAQILSSTFSGGNAGSVTIRAGELRMNGLESVISSSAEPGSGGDAGSVVVTVNGRMEMSKDAQILSFTFSVGNAGSITIRAGELTINGQDSESLTRIDSSSAKPGSGGDAGSVEVTVNGLMEMCNGALILSSTLSAGNAGSVTIRAGELRMDGQGSVISSSAEPDSGGDAGSVEVTVNGLMEMCNGARIGSPTFSDGDAGSVTIRAGEIRMDGQDSEVFTGIASSAEPGSAGDAGSVEVTVNGLLEMSNGAQILSSTFSEGRAGNVIIHANRIGMDGASVISSGAASFSSGNANTVNITAEGQLEITGSSLITSSTQSFSFGNAGNVIIKAGEIVIDGTGSEYLTGVSSLVEESAYGHVGSVDISADTVTVKNSGQISIEAGQTLPESFLTDIPETEIRINTNELHLDQNARITAESTGNVPAAQISIQTDELLVENSSRITTSSNEADGGPIFIQGETLILRDGLVTTSVEGEAGNGGNITVTGMTSGPADVLVFDGGFIQANTAAQNAKGGDIFIDAKAVIANNDSLEVGGSERQTFEPGSGQNIIQAAAPGGEQGNINITAPALNISGSLINISSGFAAPVTPSADSCRFAGTQNASSLVLKGRGGIPPDPDHFSVLFFGKDRLERLQEPEEQKEEE